MLQLVSVEVVGTLIIWITEKYPISGQYASQKWRHFFILLSKNIGQINNVVSSLSFSYNIGQIKKNYVFKIPLNTCTRRDRNTGWQLGIRV